MYTTQHSLPSRAKTVYFRCDPRLTPAESSTLDVYKNSVYSRGHVTAAGN